MLVGGEVNCRALVAALLATLTFACIGAGAQSMGPTVLDGGARLVVDLDVVDVYFNVRRGGQFVPNLNKEEFLLTENGHEQLVRYFSAESHAPLNLAILVDVSSSQTRVLPREFEVAKRFLDQVLAPSDKAMLVGFDYYVQMQQDFTSSPELIMRALERSLGGSTTRTAELDPGPLPKARSTALNDALFGVAEARMSHRGGRKVIIVLTDGQDMLSRRSPQEATHALLKADTICYVLLLGDNKYTSNNEYVGIDRMKRMARETGGRVINVDADLSNLAQSFQQIESELRHHYSIGYQSSDRTHDGQYRTIMIQSKHGFQVQARRGYYAPLPHSDNVPHAAK